MIHRTTRSGDGSRGFTLVEMLISLAIFAVVTAMAVANFRAGAQGDELRVSARIIASTVRRAQTQAVAGSSVFFCHGGTDEGKVCPSGDDIDFASALAPATSARVKAGDMASAEAFATPSLIRPSTASA